MTDHSAHGMPQFEASEDIDLARVRHELSRLAGVTDDHHLHAWTLTSNRHVFTAHLRITDEASGAEVLETAHQLLREKFGFYFSTVQRERACLDENHARDLDVSAFLRRPLDRPARLKIEILIASSTHGNNWRLRD